MKNINSKSFKQYPLAGNKRTMSPFLANNGHPTLSNSKSAKKKPTIRNSLYQRGTKQFQSYGRMQNKKISHCIDIQESAQKHNKFRIVTEPVDDRIMHLAQSNIFNSSLGIKNNKKIQSQIRNSNTQVRVNLRQTQHNSQSKSRQRIYTNPTNNNKNEQERQQKNRNKSKDSQGGSLKCRNCKKYEQQFEYIYNQIKTLIKTKQLWKCSSITYEQVQNIYKKVGNMNRPRQNTTQQNISIQKNNLIQSSQNKKIVNLISQSHPYSHNSLQNIHKFNSTYNNITKNGDCIIQQIKNTILDLVIQIEALASIDYPKMLQMQIFKYQPSYSQYIDTQQLQLKDLFDQLRKNVQGKTVDYDTYDSQSENNYTKMIMRNMKSRLSATLRENLQLKICKTIYEKSQQISEESEEYLRKVIEEVVENYVEKKKIKEKEKERERDREKQKERQRESKQKIRGSKR